MTYAKLVAALFVSLTFAVTAWSGELDELREKAKAMQKEAAELAEQGYRQEAEQIEREAAVMLKKAQQLERRSGGGAQEEIAKLRERLEMLRFEERELNEAAGNEKRLDDVRRTANNIERELHKLSRHRHPGQHRPETEVARRLEHMRAAVDHLHQAGLHGTAEDVAVRAEAVKRELHQQQRPHEADTMHEIMKQLDKLRQAVGRLQDEVHELRESR